MDEDIASEKMSENGKVKRLIRSSLVIAVAGAALAAGVKMRGKTDVAAIRRRLLPARWKNTRESGANGRAVD